MKIKPLLDLFTFVRVAITGNYRINHPFKGDGAHHAVGTLFEGDGTHHAVGTWWEVVVVVLSLFEMISDMKSLSSLVSYLY
jgi:hypothetical protein